MKFVCGLILGQVGLKPLAPDTILSSGSVWFGGTFGHELLYQYCGLAILVGQGQLASVE